MPNDMKNFSAAEAEEQQPFVNIPGEASKNNEELNTSLDSAEMDALDKELPEDEKTEDPKNAPAEEEEDLPALNIAEEREKNDADLTASRNKSSDALAEDLPEDEDNAMIPFAEYLKSTDKSTPDPEIRSQSLRQLIGKCFKVSKGLFAYDEEGHTYEKLEEIIQKIDDPENHVRLYVFDSGMEYPYAIEKDAEDGYLISRRPVSLQYPLDSFEVKKTLKLNDIRPLTPIAQYESDKEILGKDINVYKRADTKAKLMEFPDLDFNKGLAKLNQEREAQGLSKLRPLDDSIDKPDKPKPMTFGQKLARTFVKILTIGIGDTAKGREMKQYQVNLDAYEKRKEEYNTATKPLQERRDELIRNAKKRIAEAEKMDQHLNQERAGTKGIRESESRDYKEVIHDYQKHMEVRLAGIQDIKKNGITPDNIFAEIWRLKGKIEGREYTSELDETIAQYLLYSSVENTILNERAAGAEGNELKQMRQIQEVTSHETVHELMKSHLFNDLMDQQSSEPLNCEHLLEEFQTRRIQLTAEGPVRKLKEYRKELIQQFGYRKVTADCLNDAAKLNCLDHIIRQEMKEAEKQRRNPREAVHRLKDKDAELILLDLKNDTEISPEVRAGLNKYKGPVYQKALEDMERASEKAMQETLKDMNPDSYKYRNTEARMNSVRKHSLNEICEILQKKVNAEEIRQENERAQQRQQQEKVL